jgi:hypothetical protein
MSDDVCGCQRYERARVGYWEPSEDRCTEKPVYEVRVTTDYHDEWLTMCPEHTAWARASWSAVTGVRQATR